MPELARSNYWLGIMVISVTLGKFTIQGRTNETNLLLHSISDLRGHSANSVCNALGPTPDAPVLNVACL